ncbi:MAG: class I SAM-dependent methyltransferase [Candidatus Niyogibacteria bacterium]|nr:class I SAM-dependent methyltransferase [Candidatus Niyogibacteria bacterium]
MGQEKVACNNCCLEDFYTLTAFRGNEGYDFLGKEFKVVLCKNCGLCFLNPRPNETSYSRYYAGGLGSRRRQGFGGQAKKETKKLTKEDVLSKKHFQRLYAEWLNARWGLQKDARIVEIGCGMGAFLYFLKELGYENVSGIEMGKDAAEKARTVLGIPVLIQDFFSHSFEAESFDAVAGVALIEHMMDPHKTIARMSGLLKTGGMLYLNTPNLLSLTFRKQFFKFVHTYYFTLKTLTSMLGQEGFEVTHALSVPTLASSSNLLFPENCIPGEMHIIAKKTGIKKSPIKTNYRDIIALYQKRKLQELPYIMSNKIFLNKYAEPLRKIRAKFRDRYKKNPKKELEEFFRHVLKV